MAYGVKYQFSIEATNGDKVDIFLLQRDYSGQKHIRALGRAPILKRERNGCILGTSLEIFAECRVDGEFAELYTSDAYEFKVEVYKRQILQWTGFVSPELYAEPDIAPPYDVQIIATDGLGELKNYDFAAYDRPKSYPAYIESMLEHTGLALAVEVISDLQYYDEGWSDAIGLESIVVDLSHKAGESCYDVLQAMLTSVNACITQQDGSWTVIRESDLYSWRDTVGSVEFGSMRSCDWWPVGNLNADVIPAKKYLSLTSENHYKPSVLQNSAMASDEGWVKEYNAAYDETEKAYILPDGGSNIRQTVNFFTEVGYRLFLHISARNVGDAAESQKLGVMIKINGRTYQAGDEYWLVELADYEGKYVWSNIEGYLDFELPEPSDSETRADASDIEVVIPLYNYDSRSYAYATSLEVTIFNISGVHDIYLYECSIQQYEQPLGHKIEAVIANGARESVSDIELALNDGTYVQPAAQIFRNAIPIAYHSEAIIQKWKTPVAGEGSYLSVMAKDYAMQVALPRMRYRGKLNVPSMAVPVVPLLFSRDGTYYFLNTYSYDLLNDELEVELISIPSAVVSIESEKISAIALPGTASGTGTGGSGVAGGGDASITFDTEMSDSSRNAVENRVIKAYVDTKTRLIAEVLKDKVTLDNVKDYTDSKFFSQAQFDPAETHKYIKTYVYYDNTSPKTLTLGIDLRIKDDIANAAEDDLDNGIFRNGLVTALGVKNWVESKNYLTSAAMTNYATKNDIKDFVVKGTTLAHYGITDAVVNGGNNITPDSPGPTLGFATIANGWPYQGAAMMIGSTGAGQLRLISTFGEGYTPDIFVSGRYLNNESVWCRIITDKNIGANAIAADNDGKNLLATDTLAKCGYVYGENGWRTTGPALITNRGGYSGLFNFAMTNTTTNPDAFNLYINVNAGGTLGNWAKVLTDKDAGVMQVRGRYDSGDANDFLSAGSYEVWGGGAISNVPIGYGTILISRGSASNMYFTSQLLTDAQGHLYSRMSEGYAANWRDWRTIIDDNNISQYAITQSSGDDRYLKLIGGTLTGQLYIETSTGDRYIHSKCDTAHIAFGVGSGGEYRGIFDINDGKWWIVRNNSDYTEIVSATMSLVGKVNVTGVLEARSGITLGNVTRTSWPTEGIAKNSILLPNNAFDNFGKIQFSQLDNALYAAAHRFNITLNGFNSDSKGVLFNGNYEDSIKVPVGQTATIRIDNNGSYIIAGYPYGKIVLSFYYQSVPASVSVRVYNTYGTPGWYTLSLSEVRGSNGGVFVFDNTSYYGITEIEIAITAKADIEASLAEIDWFLTRASLSNLPVVTKFAIDQELYGTLICKGGITLGSKTITSWSDFITSEGGTINAGKYLNIGSASLAYKAISPDYLNKLVISGLVSIGNLYMRERLYIEASAGLDARIAFRDGNGTITDYINSFDDLRIKVVERTETSGVSIAPNVLNRWTTPLTDALTINFSAGRTGVANYYMMEFTTGATVPTITLPSGITWQGGDNILSRLEPNKTYQISVLNNLAVGGAF